jgi:hypothetical protein
MVNLKSVMLDINGVHAIPYVAPEQGRVFRVTGLLTQMNSYAHGVRFFTGFPSVCIKYGKPAHGFSVAAGVRDFGVGTGRQYLSVANGSLDAKTTDHIFCLIYHEREIIARPTCGTCDVTTGILFGYEYMSISNYIFDNHNKNYFYTIDLSVANNLRAQGFSVEEVIIQDGRETRPAFSILDSTKTGFATETDSSDNVGSPSAKQEATDSVEKELVKEMKPQSSCEHEWQNIKYSNYDDSGESIDKCSKWESVESNNGIHGMTV